MLIRTFGSSIDRKIGTKLYNNKTNNDQFMFFLYFLLCLAIKKMSFSVLPECVFNRLDNCLDELKANNLNSVWLARCVRYIGCKTKNHDRLNICSCFKCKLA